MHLTDDDLMKIYGFCGHLHFHIAFRKTTYAQWDAMSRKIKRQHMAELELAEHKKRKGITIGKVQT